MTARRLWFVTAAAFVVLGWPGTTLARAGDEPGLKGVAPAGLRVGAAVNRAQVEGRDPVARGIVERHFGTLTAENDLKWARVHPEPDRYAFGPADAFVAFGERLGAFLVGHTLVWHQQTPRWVFEGPAGGPLDRDTARARLREHIHSVVGRYRGRIHGWDVVNEALDEDGNLRRTPWLEAIGEDYVALAFALAHEADPEAELYYNDYNLWKPAKRDAALRLVRDLVGQGLRVDGLGEQAHWGLETPSLAEIDALLEAVEAAGLTPLITELDVDVLPRDPEMWGADLSQQVRLREETDVYPDGLPEAMQQRLARRYAALFAAFVRHGVARVTFWGVHDGASWLHDFPIRGRTNHPLLWDRDGRPKPAFHAVRDALRRSE